jgi:hypothetical protein
MKSKVSVILLGILVFLLGSVAGVVGHYLYREHVRQALLKAAPPRFDFVEGMAKELKLNSTQKESLKIIVADIRKRTMNLNKEFRPKYDAINKEFMPKYETVNKDFMPQFEVIRKDSDQRIKALLRDDQKSLFENFLRKFQKTYQRQPQMKNNADQSSSNK